MGLFGLGRKKYDLDLDKEIGELNKTEEAPKPFERGEGGYETGMSGANYGNQPMSGMGEYEASYGQNPENRMSYDTADTGPYMGQNEGNKNMQRTGRGNFPQPQSKSEAAQIMISKLEVINSKIDLILNRLEKLEKKNEEQEEATRKRYW